MTAAAREEAPAPAVLRTVGAELRAAREARGLTLAAVAAHLKLDPATVQSLEEDKALEVVAPAYVRGYIRGYARVLGTDPAPLLDLLSSFGVETPPPLKPTSTRHRPQARSGDRPVLLVSIVVVVTLAGLVAAWWHNRARPAGIPLLPEAGAGARGEAAPARPAATFAPAPPATPAGPQPARPTEPDAPMAADPQAPSPQARPGPQAPQSVPGPAQGAAVPAAPSAATPAAPDPGPTGDRPLTLNVRSGESWIEVYDATGARLYYDVVRGGGAIGLSGTAPYRLVLGNAAGVEVRYRGATVDLGPFSNNGVARLQVAESGAASP
ncbi:MAG: RodZ domain-containing protein [Gammaproteobacteria bacterium]